MRCPDCNKFTSFDDSNEPEVDDADVDDEGHVTGNVRVYLTCAECGTELKEATFELEADFSKAVEAHKKAAKEQDAAIERHTVQWQDHGLEVEVACEMASRTQGRKAFHGYEATIWVTCSCGHKFLPDLRNDDILSSQMEELT